MEEEKPVEKDEAYKKIESIVRDTPNPTNLFSRRLNPTYTSAVSQNLYKLVKEDAAKIKDYETKTTDLTTKLDSALAENQKLESANTSCQTKISELGKELGETQKKYELLRKAIFPILPLFSDEELENTLYQREERSIIQAEAEDDLDEMGFEREK